MKVVVVTGSAHKKGSSALFADEFTRGALEAGHEVERFDAAFADVKGCLGCGHCRAADAPCVRKDDMNDWIERLIDADAIAFAMPVYYFGMPAQIKAVFDRFYAAEGKLRGNKKAVLLVTAGSTDPAVTKNVEGVFHDVLNWMEWDNAGEVLGVGCYTRKDAEDSAFSDQAYKLGKSL